MLASFLTGKPVFHYSLGQRYINQKQTVKMKTPVIYGGKKTTQKLATAVMFSAQITSIEVESCNRQSSEIEIAPLSHLQGLHTSPSLCTMSLHSGPYPRLPCLPAGLVAAAEPPAQIPH